MSFRKLDARCLSNLLWALAKLDFGGDGTALTTSIALNVVPFVLRSLEGGNPQVGVVGPAGLTVLLSSRHAGPAHPSAAQPPMPPPSPNHTRACRRWPTCCGPMPSCLPTRPP